MTFGNLIPLTFLPKYPQVVAIGYPRGVGISMVASMWSLKPKRASQLLITDQKVKATFSGLKAGLIWHGDIFIMPLIDT